jgi:hypothetical protein
MAAQSDDSLLNAAGSAGVQPDYLPISAAADAGLRRSRLGLAPFLFLGANFPA